MTLEANIVRGIQRLLDQRGAWHFKTTGVTAAGIPDINGSYRGRALALEVKRPGNKPTRRQVYQLDRARAAGAIAEVVHSAAEVAQLLDAIDLQAAA